MNMTCLGARNSLLWYNIPMNDENCAYCAEGELVEKFGIRIAELAASKVYLFREQSHRGRVIVASKRHVSELVDLERRERQAFMDDVAKVASVLHRLFNPEKVNYGAYGDTCGHLHFHLVPKYAADAFEWGTPFAMDPKRTYLGDAEYADLVASIKAELAVGDGTFDFRKALLAMQREIKADGKVDFQEATVLLTAMKHLEGSGATTDAFIKVLGEVRADGVITKEESEKILKLLDELLA